MSTLRMNIHAIKGIENGEIELPIQNSIMAIVGNNGTGKSTIMSCLAQLLSRHNLGLLRNEDYTEDSYVSFSYEKIQNKWKCVDGFWKEESFPKTLRFNGTFEGSLFYGVRFTDSKNVDNLMQEGKIEEHQLVEADEYIHKQLGVILHNDADYYQPLIRMRNRNIAQSLNLKNAPYFMKTNNGLISQYRMSSGECLLISLLHFIYNSIIRKSLPTNKPIVMLIDEVELALHPVAVSNLLTFMNELINEYTNLTVILSTHASEVIRQIDPNNIFKIERTSETLNNFNVVNPCYPSYAIRDIYMHDGFDYLILVEDLLAKLIVDSCISDYNLNESKLINVLPVGGWKNVLNLQQELIQKNVLGIGKEVFSVLDGDVQGSVNGMQKNLKKVFLPIKSVEKYLLDILIINPNIPLKKKINDRYFQMKSIDALIKEYKSEEKAKIQVGVKDDSDGKRLYAKLINYLKGYGVDSTTFVVGLYQIFKTSIDMNGFAEKLKRNL